MRYIERIIFFLLLTSIPIQLGKHFWPNFSFVQGIRVDYLSPTIYLTDILLVILFLISFRKLSSSFLNLFKSRLYLLFIFALILSSISSFSPQASLFGILKFFEIFFFAFYVSQKIQNNQFLLILSLTIGGIIEVSILFMQFILQGSIGGFYYYFGERTFSASTPDVALFSFGQSLMLRPYGTFPHPNVAAFYLLFSFIILLFSMNDFKNRYLLVVQLVVMILLFLGVLVTFSRIVTLLLFCVILLWFIFKVVKGQISYRKTLIFLAAAVIVVMGFFIPRVNAGILRDIMFRLNLVEISLKIFFQSPIVGVGLNNFYYHEILFQKNITPTLLQPVHNIYLLTLSTIGLFGFILSAIFLVKTIFKIKRNTFHLTLFGTVVVVGLFDHYLLTLQQGQLLLGLIFGILYSPLRNIKAWE